MIDLTTLISEIFYDFEYAHLKTQAAIEKKRKQIEDGEVYPHIKEIKELHEHLKIMLDESFDLEQGLRQHQDVSEIDYEEGELDFEDLDQDEMDMILDFLGGFLFDLQDLKEEVENNLTQASNSIEIKVIGITQPSISQGAVYYDREVLTETAEFTYSPVYTFSKQELCVKQDNDQFHNLELEFSREISRKRSLKQVRKSLIDSGVITEGEALISVLPESSDSPGFPFGSTIRPISKYRISQGIKNPEEGFG